ncbi:hypothetical protein D8674_001103 [Pyrus ussuriensis x Pyrus communis]|uniref:DUF4378 domain-containing protein n=1 Tax=Pyrus ussuriensis x Pyrus communis TaxID=2448454 RepID=A0A5N5F5Y4_9ROSA|nr:hypothetical protein D8674_001103 [Pyrus ussuriensis x Pyrus communis]
MEATGTPSVMEKLMGLNESPPQAPVQKQRRVLSENYLRRVASIGARESRHSFRLRVPEIMDYEGDYVAACLPRGSSLISEHRHNLQVSASTCTSGSGNIDICRKSGRRYELPNATLLETFENGIVTESLGEVGLLNSDDFSRSQLGANKEGCIPSSRIVVLKGKQGKAEISARCFPSLSSLDDSHSSDRKCMEYSSPGGGKLHVEVKERKNLTFDMEPVSLRSTVLIEILGKLTENTSCNKTNIDATVSRLGSRGGNSVAMKTESMRLSSSRYQSFPYSDESYVYREAKKQLSKRRKMINKLEEAGMARIGATLWNSLAMSAQETGSRTLDDSLVRHLQPKRKLVRDDDLDLSKFRTQQDKYAALCNEWSFKPKGSINLGQHKSREYQFNQNDGFGPIKLRSNRKKLHSYPSLEFKGVHTVEKTSGNFKKQQSGRRAGIFVDKNDNSSSHGTDASVQQETSIEDKKEGPFLLHCSTTESDCMGSLEEADKPSPVSVLEPIFSGEQLPTPEFPRRMNVDITDYSDTYSEGSGMIVSSDDDDDTIQGSASSYRENEDSMGLFRVEESRDYSYLVDVLSEIGFYGRNSTMDLGTWCPPEWPLSLAVFETLEKKFGDQASWKRSDRRLLFDRINATLMEIFEPCMGVPTWTKPMSRRIRSTPSEEMIEEDLWVLLVSQEKEKGKDSAEKALGREIELDLGDDIDGIGKEIERFLFDKLIAEFVTMESF